MKLLEKKTEFTGYCSGDLECFCLADKPLFDESGNTSSAERKTIYPDEFFPEECDLSNKKYKFTITVIAEEVKC
jgi:hypothetical protein